jgi:hypothetical protein
VRFVASRLFFGELTLSSNVIWMGDMNYRIDLDNLAVRSQAESGELDMLVAADQVRLLSSLLQSLMTF